MDKPTTVDVCICTFRRPHVVNTLASVSLLEIPEGVSLRVIVADNDDTPSAQIAVEGAAAQHGLNLRYLHAPARNISVARNACLDAATGDYLAFIDDDEIVETGWLKALLAEAEKSYAPIVLGPVYAIYAPTTPHWMRAGDFHSTKPTWVNGIIRTGYAGNVLILRSAPALQGLRFREDLGISGGEDTAFFGSAHAAGALIAYAKDAVALEGVPEQRATYAWLRGRRFRYGQTHAMLLMGAGEPHQKHLLLATIKGCICYAMATVYALFPLKRRQWLLRGALHWGAVAQLRQGRTGTA